MKLHLPKGLRAALIAAIATIGFTLPNAWAADPVQLTLQPTDKLSVSGGVGSITAGNSKVVWTGGDSTLNSWRLTFDLTVTNETANDFFNISSRHDTAQVGWAIGTTGTTLQLAVGGKTGSAVITLSDAFTIGAAQSVTFQFERNVDDEGVSLGTGTFTIIANGQTGTYDVTSLDDTALVSDTRGHIWCNGPSAGEHQLSNIKLYQLDDHAVVVPTSTWNGTSTAHDWNDNVWNGTEPYADGNKAVFGADAYTTVSITSAVQASAVSVSAQNYTFETDAFGSLEASKMNIADGYGLTVRGTVEGAGEVNIAALSGAGSLTVGANGTATVTTLSNYTGAMGVTDGGTLNLGASVQLDNLTVADGTVTTQHSGGSGVIVNDLNINAGGVFRVVGQHDAFGYGTGTTKNIVMQGAADHIAALSLEQTTTNSVTMNANLQLKGYAHITTTANGFNTHDGAIYAEGEDNSIDQFQLRHAATIEVAEDGVLTVGDMTYGADGQHILTKTGAGTLSFTGTANMQALKLQDGILVIDGGTATVENIATAPSTINKTIVLRAGTLDVTTAVLDISGMGGITTKDYSDGQVAGNGFATVGGTIDVVNVGESATLAHDGVQVKYNGMDLTMNDDGDVVVEEHKSLAAFYVNVAGSAESLDNAVTKGEGELTTVDLGNNTTLNADSADAVLATLQVREDASATVALSQDLAVDTITVTTEGKSLTLSGAGVLSAGALQGAGNVVIGTGTTLALNGIGTAYTGSFTANEGGTLQLTTNSLPEILTVNGEGALRMMVSAGGQNIDPQKVEAKNVVLAADEQHNSRFRYVTATDLSGVGHLSFEGGQLWLNNKDMTGENAFAGTVTFGTTVYSESNAFGGAALRVDRNGTFTGAVEVKENTKFTWGANMTVEFAGAVTGSGNLELARYNGNGTFKISGDASAYAGALTSVANVALSVESNAKLTLAGGSDLSGAVTVGGELTMNSAEGTTSTIGGSISGTGTLNKVGAGILEVSGAAAATSTVAVNVNGGTLKATVASALGSGAITVADGATLDLVNGGALGTAQIVDSSGNVTLGGTLTQGTVNGGTLTLGFAPEAELEDVGGYTDTGNGFSQAGVFHVYDTEHAELTGITDIIHGDTHYTLEDIDENGDIITSGANWSIYQLNVENEEQPTIQQIINYAAGKEAALASISVNNDMLYLVDDSTAFKTSMLSGEHLQSFTLLLDDGAVLGMDANLAGALELATDIESHATVNLEKDATVGAGIWAYSEGGTADLTIEGAHTLSTVFFGVESGTATLQGGAHLVVTEADSFGLTPGDTLTVKGASELSIPNVSIKSVDGAKDAVLTNENSENAYDIADPDHTLADAELTVSYAEGHELGNTLSGAVAVVNAGAGTLTDVNAANLAYDGLHAQSGNIVLQGKEENVAVRNLTVDAGRSVSMTDSTAGIVVGGTATFDTSATVGAALTMAGGSTLDAANPVALANHSLALGTTAGGKLAIGDDLWSTLSGLSALESANLFTGVSALTLAGSEYKGEVDLTTIFTRDGLKANKYMLSYDTTSKNVVITRQADNNRYWKGGNGTWNYTDKQWMDEETGGSEATFEEGYNAYFTASTTGTVTLGTDITAESITVSGADYTFAPNGHTLTVNKSVEADGHKATFNMALNGTDLKLTAKNGGTIILDNSSSVKDVEVDASSAVTSTSNLTVTGGFTNAGQVNVNTLTLNQGTTAGGNATVTTLELATGESYTFGNLTAGIVNGTGANLTIGTGNTLQVNSSATIGNLALANGAQLASSGTTTVSGTTAINTAASLVGSLTTGALSGTGTLTLNNGSLTFTEATTLTDTDLAFSGTSTITSQGVTLTFKGTLVHTVKGAMTFVGSFDVGNCKTDDGTATYVEGGSTGNGFKQAQKIVSIINGGSANGTNATLTYNGKSIGPMGTDGKVTFQGDTEYDKYYVNSGTEKATTALDNEKQQLGTFELKGGTTLVVDKNISMGMVNAAGAATLQIDSGKTVSTDGTTKALTLTGAGTLAVDAGKTATGVTLGNTWTGTVSFTEAVLETIADAWKTGSTVSLTGITGSLGDSQIGAAVVLNKGTGDWGFGQTATTGSQYTNLEGTLTGEGNLGVKSGTVDSTFNLNGNIDGWTGNFIVATEADTDLNFGGNGSKTVHGTVSGSNLAVNVNADTTFEGALNVAEINVDTSKAATLKADSTAGRVNAYNASLEVDDGKTLTVTGYAGPEGLKLGADASIVLQDTAYLGGEDYGYIGGAVANTDSGEQDLDISNTNLTATDTTLWVQGGTGFTVGNKLVNATLSVETPLQASVALNNVQDSLEVAGNLAIGNGGSLKVAKNNGADKQLLNIGSGTLTTGNGSALDANLTLAAGVTTDMAAELAMNGGALTLNKGLSLVGGLYDAVDALSEAGAYVNLFTGVGALTLGTDTYTEPVKALQYFTNLKDFSDRGDYYLQYDGGIVSIYFTPTDARTLTWNGTEGNSTWEVGEGTAENWLDTTLADTHFASGDNAKFTGDAEKKLVTIAQDITARNITVTDSRYTIENDADRTITADQFAVNNAALGKKGGGKLVLAVDTPVSLENGAFAVQAGDVEIGTADSAGTLEMAGSMLDIAPGSTLTVATITADTDSTIELDGTLQVAKGSVMYIEASEGSLLKIADVGTATADTLTVGADAYLYGLENHGTLNLGTNELTLMKKTAQGGNVTAAKITLAETGSTFGELKVNTIQYGLKSADDATLDAENPNLVVDSIAAGGVFPVVTLDISETMHGEGSLAPIQRTGEEVTYTLLHANDGLGSTSFTLNTGALDLLKQNGLIHADAGLVKTENDVTLTVGGLDLTWYTDKDVTEWDYTVVANDSITHGGNTLNGVEHVVVDASRTIDVTGAGSAPGLRVRNITGLDGRTLAFTGTEDDTVNLVTNEETASNVNLAAENITLKVGLDELDDMDPVDYKDLRVGDVTLTGATLDVHAHEGLDDSFTVNSLNGDSDSMLKGTLIVEGRDGDYSGEYEDATVILHASADQTLAADEGLTVMGLGLARITYSGTQTHMDGIEGIGLRVMLNDVNTDSSDRTLTLDNEYSYIIKGAVGVGLSAIETAGTLDTDEAPDLLEAEHLDMSGSTLFIFQSSADGDTLVMDVNDGGYKRGLLLANFGADDTTADVQLRGDLFFKYYQNARLQGGKVLVDRRTDYFTLITSPTSVNGRAGAGMLDDALLHNNPQVTNPDGDLAVVMTALEQGGYTRGHADRVMAAMSGASQAALGAAWNHDVDRQLRAIRNRTTQMGLAECTKHEGLPYFNAWINAEGDYRKLSADGTLAGYKLTSWGGTVGVDVDCTNRLTLGLAVTAMSGDFTAESADQAKGDLDRMYVTVFGRYTHRAWTHTFVATLGLADTKLDRTVDYGYGSYSTSSDSNGKAFGLMYELGYVAALNDDASTCIQPLVNISYRTSTLDGVTERSGSDAALRLGDAKASVFTVAAGARLQSTIGTSVYNRATLFEGRALLKADAGDRDAEASNGFVGVPAKRKTQSAKMGAFGVEVGAGITIPLSENAGALFLDFTGDFRDKYTEINGTVGYRFNF